MNNLLIILATKPDRKITIFSNLWYKRWCILYKTASNKHCIMVTLNERATGFWNANPLRIISHPTVPHRTRIFGKNRKVNIRSFCWCSSCCFRSAQVYRRRGLYTYKRSTYNHCIFTFANYITHRANNMLVNQIV